MLHIKEMNTRDRRFAEHAPLIRDAVTGEMVFNLAIASHGRILPVSKSTRATRMEFAQACLLAVRSDEFTHFVASSMINGDNITQKYMVWVTNPRMTYYQFVTSLTEPERLRVLHMLPTALRKRVCNFAG